MSRRARVEQVMGLPFSLHVRGDGAEAVGVDEAVADVYDMLRAVDARFSPYRDDSEVSAVRAGRLAVADGSPELREVLDLCEQARVSTRGVFDAWLPEPDGVVRLDPSGLVKGWALARAGERLARLVDVSCYVAGGGDVLTLAPADGPGWVVGIQDPDDPAAVVDRLRSHDGAVATSGTYARGAHLVDPRSGRRPARTGSASVVGPSIVTADVLATALAVAGEDLLDVVVGLGYEALLLGPGPSQRTVTAGWPSLVEPV